MAPARRTDNPETSVTTMGTVKPDSGESVIRQSPAQRGALLQYQRAQVESASPTRLIVLLYEGAIRFCHLAQEAMRKRDLETQNTNLVRAQRIVGELLASLNRGAGGEVASNLSNIYAHILEELVKANLYDKPEKLNHVIALLSEMRASWAEIDSIAACNGPLLDAPQKPGASAEPKPEPPAVKPRMPVADPARMARIAANKAREASQAPVSRLGDQRA